MKKMIYIILKYKIELIYTSTSTKLWNVYAYCKGTMMITENSGCCIHLYGNIFFVLFREKGHF